MRTLLTAALALALLLPAADVLAQEPDTDVPQKFWFEIGGFRVASNTDVSLGGALAGDDVSFERDLDIPSNTTQAYFEVFWRLGRRHQVSANWTRVKRTGDRVLLDEEIVWGDYTFGVGADVQGTNDTDFLSGVYRFALFKSEKFEIGPAIGLGHIWIDASLTGEARLSAGEDELVRSVESQGSVSTITGDIGGYARWWPGRRFLARGDFRYIAVGLDDADAAITEGRASLTWYPWRQVGFGAQYSYTKMRFDRARLASRLGGTIQYDGLQVLVSVAF